MSKKPRSKKPRKAYKKRIPSYSFVSQKDREAVTNYISETVLKIRLSLDEAPTYEVLSDYRDLLSAARFGLINRANGIEGAAELNEYLGEISDVIVDIIKTDLSGNDPYPITQDERLLLKDGIDAIYDFLMDSLEVSASTMASEYTAAMMLKDALYGTNIANATFDKKIIKTAYVMGVEAERAKAMGMFEVVRNRCIRDLRNTINQREG